MEEPCASCRHRRLPAEPRPSVLEDRVGKQPLRWILEWEELRDQRRLKEDDLVDRGSAFHFAPWFYAWCARKSRRSGPDEQVRSTYILAEALHAGDVCDDYEPLGADACEGR